MKIIYFYIENFRSLKKFEVNDFSETTIFFGLNNAGKSNVLNALNTIFKRKRMYHTERGSIKKDENVTNFYTGIVENIRHDFFDNTSDTINFKVTFSLSREEILMDEKILKSILNKRRIIREYKVKFDGKIYRESLTNDDGIIKLNDVSINDICIYNSNNVYTYFPSVKKMSVAEEHKVNLFEKIIEPFNDCVAIVPSARDMLNIQYDNISTESHDDIINSSNFKKYLHGLYLSINKNYLFEKINKVFNNDPFHFGNLSFSVDNGNLEIMVQEESVRLPIKYLGSGVLQILYIFAFILSSKSKIICIEELEQNLAPSLQYETYIAIKKLLYDGSINQLLLSSHSSVFSKPKLGTIYKLEKQNRETIIYNTLTEENKEKLKNHLKDYRLPNELYTEEEQKKSFAEVNILTEERFKA